MESLHPVVLWHGSRQCRPLRRLPYTLMRAITTAIQLHHSERYKKQRWPSCQVGTGTSNCIINEHNYWHARCTLQTTCCVGCKQRRFVKWQNGSVVSFVSGAAVAALPCICARSNDAAFKCVLCSLLCCKSNGQCVCLYVHASKLFTNALNVLTCNVHTRWMSYNIRALLRYCKVDEPAVDIAISPNQLISQPYLTDSVTVFRISHAEWFFS